jgi:hypothetical protein
MACHPNAFDFGRHEKSRMGGSASLANRPFWSNKTAAISGQGR